MDILRVFARREQERTAWKCGRASSAASSTGIAILPVEVYLTRNKNTGGSFHTWPYEHLAMVRASSLPCAKEMEGRWGCTNWESRACHRSWQRSTISCSSEHVASGRSNVDWKQDFVVLPMDEAKRMLRLRSCKCVLVYVPVALLLLQYSQCSITVVQVSTSIEMAVFLCGTLFGLLPCVRHGTMNTRSCTCICCDQPRGEKAVGSRRIPREKALQAFNRCIGLTSSRPNYDSKEAFPSTNIWESLIEQRGTLGTAWTPIARSSSCIVTMPTVCLETTLHYALYKRLASFMDRGDCCHRGP